MWEDDESIPDETDGDSWHASAPPEPAAAHKRVSELTQPVERRLNLEPLREESIYDFVFGRTVSGAAPTAGAARTRPAIVHKRAVREESEIDGDERRWDERAPRAKHEHIPQLPCRFFNTPTGCRAADCRFAHVQAASGASTSASRQACKFWKAGRTCFRGASCGFMHD